MNATTATQTFSPTVNAKVVLDLVGATGTVVHLNDDGAMCIRWSRSGKSFWYGRGFAGRLLAL